MSRLNADLALLFAAVVWGFAFLFQKSAMDHIGPLTFIATRGAVAALVLAPFALMEVKRRGGGMPSSGFWRIGIISGGAFFVAAWLQQAGLVTATVTNTGFLTALYVVITPFIAWVAMRRRPNALVWPAVALSTLGTWLLGGGTLSAFSTGDGLVALSAGFWAMHVVIVGQAAVHARPIAFTCLQFLVVAVCAAVAATWLEPIALLGIAAAAPDILYVGVLSSALTFTLLTVALQYTPPSEAAVIVSLETVFAAIGAYWLLGERLSTIGWLGAGLILLATLVIQLGGAKSPSPSPAEKPNG